MLAPEPHSHRPELLSMDSPAGRERIEQLRSDGATWVTDTLPEQLLDLVTAELPRKDVPPEERRRAIEQKLRGRAPDEYGTWVHFPWSRRLVHVLPRREFRSVRADRNRYLILPNEQEALREKRIGIVGLSVGQAGAVTMALEGIGGELRLADFDTLSLSNLNRLRGSVADLGVNKAVLAARAIAEADPYLEVRLFEDGVTEECLDAFLLEGGALDLLVEECDDLYMKVRLRERARALRIPVVMQTSDRGLIDVERFDLEPGRPLFHGLLGDVDAAALGGLSNKEKVPFALRILGEQGISPASAASLVEVEETLSTWPQLASAVALGGGLIADVARRILTGRMRDSGRFYVDLEALVADGTAVRLGGGGPLSLEPIPESRVGRARPPRPSPGKGRWPSRDEIRYLVAHAILAPSGGNAQPWRFRWDGARLVCEVDERRADTALDFRGLASQLSLGAAVENIVLASGDVGLLPALEVAAAGKWVSASIQLSRGQPAPFPLAGAICERVSNRRLADPRPLSAEDVAAMERAIAPFGGRLRLLAAAEDRERAGRLIGAGERICACDEALHAELMGEIRWTQEEALGTRDGMDLPSMELSRADAAAMRIVASWSTMRQVRRFGGGRALERTGLKAARQCSAIGLLTVEGTGASDYFRGGRALERCWLVATQRGLALQPQAPLPYLFARLERGGGEGLEPHTVQALREMSPRYASLWGAGPGEAHLLMFRLAHAGPPTAISLRRHLDEFLSFA